MQCVTKDQIQVSLDGTLIYNISKPQVAVYETDGVCALFASRRHQNLTLWNAPQTC